MNSKEMANLWILTVGKFVEGWRERYLESAEDNGYDDLVKEAERAYELYMDAHVSLNSLQGKEEDPAWTTAMCWMLQCYSEFIAMADTAYGR